MNDGLLGVSLGEWSVPRAVSTLHERASARSGPWTSQRLVRMWRARHALRLLVSRDLKLRYTSSFLGYVWSVLEPLLMSGVYWFVFTQVFHRSAGEAPYMVFLLSGLLPWTWFSSGVTDCSRVLRTEARLVRSLSLPREIWVCRVVAVKGVEFAFSIPVLFLFVLCYGAPMNWRIVFLLPAVLILGVLLMGVGLLLSPLVVLVPDLQRLVRLALRVSSYASPVVYAVSDVPRRVSFLFAANPMSGIVELCRSGFFPNQLDWRHVALSVLLAFGTLFVGWIVFRRFEQPVLKEL